MEGVFIQELVELNFEIISTTQPQIFYAQAILFTDNLL